MEPSIYNYRDYKAFLRDAIESRGGRGLRSRLAEAAGCHTAYVSQTLNGDAHFSLEQAEKVASFLELGAEPTTYFLLLIQYARAGTASLKRIFEKQMQAIIESQRVLKNRLEFKRSLSAEDQATFYSSWHYGAVHVLVSVPGCHTEEGMAAYLGLPRPRVAEVIEFLLKTRLVIKRDGRFDIGTSHIHLPSDSPMISKHHTNWRVRAIQSLDLPRTEDLHYSSVITASREDAPKIREILVHAIEQVRAIVKSSGNEEGYAYSLDFFSLLK